MQSRTASDFLQFRRNVYRYTKVPIQLWYKQSRRDKSQGLLKKTKYFVEISDVAVNQQKLLFILDKGAGSVYVMTETGEYKSKLSLMLSSSSGVLKNVHSIAVTDQDLLIVSDPGCGKVLQFRADGSFAFCLLDFSKKTGCSARVYGVAINASNELTVAVSGPSVSEIRVYRL